MGRAKEIILKAIEPKRANEFMRRVHYSGKIVNNSQLHIGVFSGGILGGVMQYGCSMDKRKIMGLVKGTKWNEFIELNRLAFTDILPRNSESRAIAISMKLLKKHAPHVKWVISFADATQCGDGTIYRASGFVLTAIKKNTTIWQMPNGYKFNETTVRPAIGTEKRKKEVFANMTVTKGKHIKETGASSMKRFIEIGATKLKGYQLRYIYFIDKTYRQKLTVPEIPFGRIKEVGAGMYKGESAAIV